MRRQYIHEKLVETPHLVSVFVGLSIRKRKSVPQRLKAVSCAEFYGTAEPVPFV
jgi:hypothetical protein